MVRTLSILALLAGSSVVMPMQTNAASFDCAKAATPFEDAICDHDALSAADLRLALTYDTAVGGLSEKARNAVRTGQREWLSYAQRACTRDAKPLSGGAYDERGLECLVEIFNGRSRVLEQSRMVNGLRFYPMAQYEALQDPYEAEEPDSYWPVARHELSWIELDSDEGFALAFNDTVRERALASSPVVARTAEEDDEGDSNTSDSNNTMSLNAVVGDNRITLDATTYWYGHGAAHGNWGVYFRHYLIKQGRFMEAGDLFDGDGWQEALKDLTLAAATEEHGDNLMLDDTSYLENIVVDPMRWDLSDPYALVIQFQPYEISAYAYGAPQVRVKWDDLDAYLSDDANPMRYGY